MSPEPAAGRAGRPWLVVVNFGSSALLAENFAASAEAGASGGGLVVVDNYSTEAERVAVADLCRRRGWTLVGRATNDGFAAACNAGVRAARAAGADSVVLVNPDAVVPAAVVDALAEQLAVEPLTLVSPVMVTSAGKPHFQGSRVDLRTGRMRGRTWADAVAGPEYLSSEWPYRDWLTGACLAFRVSLWEQAGGLDERYFLYWEDVDFSQRCAAAGARLCLRRDLVAVHDEGGTHGTPGSRARSPLYYYYNCRNRLLYGAVHLERRELLRWLWTTPQQSWQILLRGGRRQLLHSPRPLVAAVSGSLAGLVAAVPTLLGRQGTLPMSGRKSRRTVK